MQRLAMTRAHAAAQGLVAAAAAFVAAACSVMDLGELKAAGAASEAPLCQSERDCDAGEACVAGYCSAGAGILGPVVLAIRPLDADAPGGVFLASNWSKGELAFGRPGTVEGRLVRHGVPIEPTAAGCDGAVQLELTPLDAGPESGFARYATSLDSQSASYALSVPDGAYSLHAVPAAAEGSLPPCLRVPYVRERVEVRGSQPVVVDLDLGEDDGAGGPAPRFGLRLRGPRLDAPDANWTLDLLDASGRLLSERVAVESGTYDGEAYALQVQYRHPGDAEPSRTFPGEERLRLRPADGVYGPTLTWRAADVLLNGDGTDELDVRFLARLVSVELGLSTPSDASSAGLVSLELLDADPLAKPDPGGFGTGPRGLHLEDLAQRPRVLEAGTSVALVPGSYAARVLPEAEEAASARLEVTANFGTIGQKRALDLPARPVVSGRASPALADVEAQLEPVEPARGRASQTFLAETTGAFSLLGDGDGAALLTVMPPARSGYAWSLLPLTAGSAVGLDLALTRPEVRVGRYSAPLSAPDRQTLEATVEAYVPVDAQGRYVAAPGSSGAREVARLVPVASATANASGDFVLLLPRWLD